MTVNKWLRLASLFAMLILAFACKKDEEEDTNLYMKGALVANVPSHLIAGEEITIKASGITTPTDSLTYKWITTGFSADSLFGHEITISAPEEPGNYAVALYVTHPRYVSKTQNYNTIVLDPNSDDSFGGVVRGDDSIVDQRDGKKYYYVTAGGLDWFAFNLNWKGAGKAYMLIDALGEIYGRLYSWEEAKSACPDGWRVPDNSDWESLATAVAGANTPFDGKWSGLGAELTVRATLNSINMWKYSPNMNFKNMFGWNAIPSGNSTGNFRTYLNRGEYGVWWSADEKDANDAYYRYIYFDSPDFPYNYANKGSFGAAVRCVRDSAPEK
ncbi:MAG: hypothetical protein BGO30_04865 [Bacteroidetes bacterium 41-46]|nr:MAG: hypothetical protein BGO30_04865 [Bacteroidetes bacterium 41-46]